MGIRHSYLDMIKAFPGGWDAMAAALGFSRSGLENRIYERKGQDVSVHDSLQMQVLSNTTYFAETVAELSNGYFTLHQDLSFDDKDNLMEKYIAFSAKYGELARVHMDAIEDGEIDDKERAELMEIKRNLHSMLENIFQLSMHIYHKDGSGRGGK